MADIALVWDTKLLFEKFFVEHGFDHMLVHPATIGSPFLPPFKHVIIPTGFSNPQYSKILPYLIKKKQNVERFISNGGTLLVFGPLVDSHTYEWLPFTIEYVQRYGPVALSELCNSDVSLIAGDTNLECDGFFSRAECECVLANEMGEPVLVRKKYDAGQVIATTIHEFPTPKFIRWVLEQSKPSSL